MSGVAGLPEDRELEAALFGPQDEEPKGAIDAEAALFDAANHDDDLEAALFGKSLDREDGGADVSNQAGGEDPLGEEEEDLYGALYGDMALQEQKVSDSSALETLLGISDSKLDGNNADISPEKSPVEEDTAKLAAVVGLATPGLGANPEEEEDSDSDSDSEDEFEILVNDDHFRSPVGHSAMPPISRVPAKAPAEDDDSDSDSDSFEIILDDDGAPERKRPYEEEQGLQREYSLKLPSLPSFDGPAPENQDPARANNQEAPRVQNGMMPYGGRGGRRGWQQQRAPVNDFYLSNASQVFELNLEGLENKPWRFQGADLSDYFNFDLNEQTWKDYCQQLAQARLEQTMQGKIRVYESRATNGIEADPDLPPELADALKRDSGAQSPQLNRLGGFQAHRGGPSNEMRRFRPRDSDAVIEIQVQKDVPVESPPASIPPPPAIKKEEDAPEKGAPETAVEEGGKDANGLVNGGEKKEQESNANVDKETPAIARDENMEDVEVKTDVKTEEESNADAVGGSKTNETLSQANAQGLQREPDVKPSAQALASQKTEDAKPDAREDSPSPSRSQPARPPERRKHGERKRDAQRGVREPSRERPLSRGDGRPNIPRGRPVRPPFFLGGPQGLGERPPFWGEPGFRPPFTPYGPEGYYWGGNGPAFPGDPAFFGPRGGPFFPPGPFEPGMGPPMRPVDGPWGPPYPGMRAGPIPQALQRPKSRRESSSSSSEESSSGSGSGSESDSESSSESEASRHRSRRSESRRYAEKDMHFNEFARRPGFRTVYDDLGRPIELDPYGRPFDPRRAAEYDEFMRHQFAQGGRGFGGQGWDEGGADFRGRGRGRDGRLPEEVYAARRRERDERIERERQEKERRSNREARGHRESSRPYDDRRRGLSRAVDERRQFEDRYQEERGRFRESSRALEEDASRYGDRHRDSRGRYRDGNEEERAYDRRDDERRSRRRDGSTENMRGESRRPRDKSRSLRRGTPEEDRSSKKEERQKRNERAQERSASAEPQDRTTNEDGRKQTANERALHKKRLDRSKAEDEDLKSEDDDFRDLEVDQEEAPDVTVRQQDGEKGNGAKENGLEAYKEEDKTASRSKEVEDLSEADLAEADQRFRAGELGQELGAHFEAEVMQLELGSNENSKAAGVEGERVEVGESKEERRRKRRERRRERKKAEGKNETEEGKEERRRQRKERKEQEKGGGQHEGFPANFEEARMELQGGQQHEEESKTRDQKDSGSRRASVNISGEALEGTHNRREEKEQGRQEPVGGQGKIADETEQRGRTLHERERDSLDGKDRSEKESHERKGERDEERRRRHRERKERERAQAEEKPESLEVETEREWGHRDRKRRRHREKEEHGHREDEKKLHDREVEPRNIEQKSGLEKQRSSRQKTEELQGVGVNEDKRRENFANDVEERRPENGTDNMEENQERKRHRRHRHREGDEDGDAKRERRRERKERKRAENEEGEQQDSERRTIRDERERPLDNGRKDSGAERVHRRSRDSEEAPLERKKDTHNRFSEKQHDQRAKKDEHSLSDFEAKLRRRAERFGTSEARGSGRDADQIPRGSFRDVEQVPRGSGRDAEQVPRGSFRDAERTDTTAADPLSGFRDLDRPEEEPRSLSAVVSQGDGSGGKRKRENGSEGGTKNWNEVKFKIPGVGESSEASAKRRVITRPSEGAEAEPRPSRVVIQDLGAKKDAENARKRMFQQALLGVGAPGRKSLGRREG